MFMFDKPCCLRNSKQNPDISREQLNVSHGVMEKNISSDYQHTEPKPVSTFSLKAHFSSSVKNSVKSYRSGETYSQSDHILCSDTSITSAARARLRYTDY